MSTEPMRAAFEAWDRQQYDIFLATYKHKRKGRFMDRAIQCRWECWQAATRAELERAAMVAETTTLQSRKQYALMRALTLQPCEVADEIRKGEAP